MRSGNLEAETLAQQDRNDVATALDFLKTSLSEAQVSVRAYDTRAQIVGVGYVFALRIVGEVDGLLPETTLETIGVAVAWFVVILPVVLFGYVLVPTRKSSTIRKLAKFEERQHVLFVDTSQGYSAEDVRNAAFTRAPIAEFSHELLIVSALRDKKRQRFLRGLYAAAAAFVCLFLSQVYRTM